jgi:hypothetical protein
VSEPASIQPSACEDFGGQVGGMLADPRPRPRKHLSSVAVINLLERIGAARPQQFCVRDPSEIASHNLYLTAPQKMCHTRHTLRSYRGLFLSELTRVCALSDELDLARELAEGLTVDLGRVGSARVAAAAVLAEADGRVSEALPLYERAAKRWHDFGCLPGRAEALLGQGRCLISLG